jgi:hypothetical protein
MKNEKRYQSQSQPNKNPKQKPEKNEKVYQNHEVYQTWNN